MKCEWCDNEITDEIVYHRTHIFCSDSCKHECLGHYEGYPDMHKEIEVDEDEMSSL